MRARSRFFFAQKERASEWVMISQRAPFISLDSSPSQTLMECVCMQPHPLPHFFLLLADLKFDSRLPEQRRNFLVFFAATLFFLSIFLSGIPFLFPRHPQCKSPPAHDPLFFSSCKAAAHIHGRCRVSLKREKWRGKGEKKTWRVICDGA